MKKVLFLTAIVLATIAQCLAAQTQTNDPSAAATTTAPDKVNNVAPGSDAAKKSEAKNEPKKSDKAEKKKKTDAQKSAEKKKSDAQKSAEKKKKTDAQKPADSSSTASAAPISGTTTGVNPGATTDAHARTVNTVPVAAGAAVNTPDPSKANSTAASAHSTAPAAAVTAPAPALTNIYRVGIGDVLDVRLLNAPTTESTSTLFTVLAGGLLEYPLAGEPVAVAGLTTEEINAQLIPKIKLYDNPRLAVSVREYASHRVIVTGLVNDPGTKVLRREAVPLYVVLAEAQPRAEAARATIMRPGGQSVTVDLSDTAATSVLVVSGDVIRLIAAPPAQPQFYYIGGQINLPGQKDFHKGLTLMQAILASGGTSRFAGSEVKVMRQGEDGRLVTTRYNLKRIEEGKIPDPVLQAGDRLEVSRGGW